MQADVERIMARLLTDATYRERFLADPVMVAREAGLTTEEATAIAALPMPDLRTAARSYAHKRAAESSHARPRASWSARWARWLRR